MGESTRERLLGAAIDSLRDTQGTSLTTGRLAARAGVVQSAFYNHFASVDECRAAAMAAIKDQLTTTASLFFADLRGPQFTTAEDVEKMLLTVFERAKEHRSVYQLIVGRSHTTEISELVDDVLATIRRDLAARILANAPPRSPMGPDQAAQAAAFAIAVIVAGIEQVLSGARVDRTAAAVSRFIVSGVFAFHALEPSALEPSALNPTAD